MTYKIVPEIKKKGWPVYNKDGSVSKRWKKWHPKANKKERRANPKLFKKIQKRINRMPKDELAGTHTRKGIIKVSKKFLGMFPKKDRKKVADSIGKIHEPEEHRGMKPKRK